MKEITKIVFIADDGTEFFDKNACLQYEHQKQVREILCNHMVYGNEVTSIASLVSAILDWHDDEAKKN